MAPVPVPAMNRDPRSWDYAWKSFVAGGVAGCAAKSVVAPLDRVKILFQAHSPAYAHHQGSFFGVFRAVRDIHSSHGARGLFQGHSATLIRIFPYAAVKFMAYEQYKHLIFPVDRRPTPVQQLLAGSLAGVTSVFFTYPLEVVRVRLAFSKDPHTLRALLDKIYHEHPGKGFNVPVLRNLRNFYRGFTPTVYGMIPYAGVSFMVYERLKHQIHEISPDWSPSRVHLVAGGLAGAISQTVSYPWEVIRRRMQVSGQFHVDSYEAKVYKNSVETARYIWRRHGLRGFFIGLSIGYLKVTPMSMVSFWTYEACKQFLHIE
ncbi:hypothetical protein GGF31_003769 [Allomyces arbusculus]|nr:hypothetical protein GGF31_003769 [Allomyces arbusculus]